jgi:peptidoglycan hydrolase-like amidase/N-acetyl-anhydromuramyl-L-alanine amidase AmpD
MLKQSLLLLTTWLLLLLYAPLKAQQEPVIPGLSGYFKEAYSQYPNIPQGTLEALAYSASHMNNLQSHEGSNHGSCMGIPERFGLFGLVEDGKGYFKNNLAEVTKLSNITAAQYKKDVRLQILAVAKFLSQEASALRVSAGASAESFSGVLERLSELPDNGTNVSQYARSLYTYDIYYHLQKGFTAPGLKAAPVKVQLEKIYPEKTLRTLRAASVIVDYDNDRINGETTPANTISTPSKVSTLRVADNTATAAGISILSADYPDALWAAAHTNNYGVGRSVAAPTNVTIHTAQGTYAGTISWFQNSTAIVSAHYVIRSSDGQVTQMVLEANRAYHVGNHNYYTVGIEHEGYVTVASYYTTAMYNSSAALVRNICTKYSISKSAVFPGPATSGTNFQPITVRVKGHQHYDQNTHTDPGINWDWPRYAALINPTATVVTAMNFTVKNQSTGAALATATVVAKSASGTTTTLTTDASGKATFSAPAAGKYTFTISKTGYKTIETFFTAATATTTLTAGINLDPTTTLAAARTGKTAANSMAINGYLTDADAGAPLAGVQVTAGKYSGVTDNNGFFSIAFPAPVKAVVQGVVPETISIVAAKKGYLAHTVKNFYLIPETYTLKIALTAETSPSIQGARIAEQVEVQQHGMLDRKAGDEPAIAPGTQLNAKVASTPVALVAAAAISVPATIRVGITCSCTTCTAVEVMSLESYVGTGVDNEWYASWNANSLQAASVAYRTYGAWYILNPVATNYDIASTTCNQVWGSESAASVKTATAATAGLVLTKAGAIFRAEYSAESNNAGCGDGFSGTGTTSGWPCISDERCKGKTNNGHGRGMCQWGSNYWGTDKTYTWILEHYYNPGGVYVGAPSTTITLTSKNMSTAAVIAGATVTVTAPEGTVSTHTTDASGKLSIGAYPGRYNVTVSATGYKAITTYFTGGTDANVTADINLDPTTTLAARTTGNAVATANSVVLNGYVRDAAASAPLAGVQVTAGMYTGTTDNDGYFSFSIPAASALTEGKVPEAVTIRSAKAGYGAYSIKNFRLIPDAYTFQISLAAGTAENGRTIQQQETAETSHHGMFDRTAADEQSGNSAAREVTASVGALAAATVPGSIRVVTNCACATCTDPQIQVMSLESYVATGVDNEWYASWAAASLQAAAVAYRSRGAWYVNNPVAGNYDISSATCHQTWGREMSASVKTATTGTAGVVLVQNGAIVKADYAAETNNSGCGNGYSGTSTTWPCISDERCLGRTTNGLGKGMCQWGSSFWATDKTYTWILDHYYAPAGIAIQAAGATLATAKEGDNTVAPKAPVASRLLVSPNPVSGNEVKINYNLQQAAQVAVVVLSDNSGRPIQQKRVALEHGDNQLTLNISTVKTGTYIVTIRLSASGTAESKKVVVTK